MTWKRRDNSAAAVSLLHDVPPSPVPGGPSSDPSLNRLLNVHEVAEMLSMPEKGVYPLNLPYIRIGRRLRVRYGDLLAWMREQEIRK